MKPFLDDQMMLRIQTDQVVRWPQSKDLWKGVGKTIHLKKLDLSKGISLQPFKTKFEINGIVVGQIPVDRVIVVTLIPTKMLPFIGKGESDLVHIETSMLHFLWCVAEVKGDFATRMKVETKESRDTLYMMDIDPTFNALTSWD